MYVTRIIYDPTVLANHSWILYDPTVWLSPSPPMDAPTLLKFLKIPLPPASLSPAEISEISLSVSLPFPSSDLLPMKRLIFF